MRVTDTRTRVREIARARLANGLPVSPSEIRRALGRGSYSTICDELERLQKELLATADERPAGADAPPSSPTSVAVDWVASARLLGQQLDQAHAERREAERQLRLARQQLHEARVEQASLLLRVQQLEQEAAALAQANAALRQAQDKQAQEMQAREALVLEQFRGLQNRMMLLVDNAQQAVTARMRELKEQVEGVHLRESAFKQQISALREENARLRGRLEALQNTGDALG